SAYGMITLISGEIVITNPLAILGPGPTNLIISGNAASRVFHIAQSTTTTIAGLTMTNGLSNGGGAIYNDHSILTVSNCTLTGNSAGGAGGAILNDGESGSATLIVVNSTLSGNLSTNGGIGGAIFNDAEVHGNATVAVTASTFSGNSAVD